MRKLSLLLLAGALLAPAATLRIDPVFQETPLGTPALVDLTIDGLGGDLALGGFDLTMLYDPAAHAPIDIAFGTSLGDLNLFEALAVVTDSMPGELRIIVTSLLDPAALSGAQPDSFVLATVTFRGRQAGVTPVTFGSLDFVDQLAQPIPVSAMGGEIEYVVPEPSSGQLFALAAVCAALTFRRV